MRLWKAVQTATTGGNIDARWAAGCILLAALIRMPGLRTDFWLDEIASLELARSASSIAEILFGLPFDNNHLLTTVWLRFVDGTGPDWVFRLPSFASGLLAIPAAMLAGSRFGAVEARLAGLMATLSSPLLVYSTEARGYAPAAALALAAMGWAGKPRRSAAFAAACVLGLFSHLTFLYVYLALLAGEWTMAPKAPVRERLARHLLPAIAATCVFVTGVVPMQVLGGPGYSVGGILAEALGLVWGTSSDLRGALVALVLTAGLFAVSWRPLRQSGLRVFYVVVLSVPVLIAFSNPAVLFARYFLAASVCLLPLMALALNSAYTGRRSRPIALAAAIVFLAGHVSSAIPFWEFGRGGYREAVAFISAQEPNARVTSDHDFRNGLVVTHYSHAHTGGPVYIPKAEARGREGIHWYIRHRARRDEPEPEPALSGPGGLVFHRVGTYRHGGPSGFDWYLYRAQD